MGKILLILSFAILCIGCNSPSKDNRQDWEYVNHNNRINDTIRLNDNHLYYLIGTHSGYQPIHSQYCNCKNTLK
jgi:hypothetical protein